MSLCCPSYSLRLSRSTMLTCSSCVIATLLILVPVYIRHKARLYECHSSPSKCVKQVALEHFLSYHLNVMPTTHPRMCNVPPMPLAHGLFHPPLSTRTLFFLRSDSPWLEMVTQKTCKNEERKEEKKMIDPRTSLAYSNEYPSNLESYRS